MQKTANERIIADDVLRYKKNKLGSLLAYVGLIFNCLYIMLLYSFNSNTFYSIEIGISVLISLVYLLACFLSSEGVKVYNKKYAIFLLVLAAIQIVRIFGLPMKGLRADAFTTVNAEPSVVPRDYFGFDLSKEAAFTILIVYLILSAACLVGSAVYSYMISVRHEKHNKAVDEGKIDIDAVLREIEAGEPAAAVGAAGDSSVDAALKNTEKELDSEDKEVQ